MIYPDTFCQKLGFDTITKRISQLCASAPGRQAADGGISFSTEFDFIVARLKAVNEMSGIIESGDPFSLNSLADLTAELNSIRVQGTFLSAADFSALRSTLQCVESISEFFKKNDQSESEHPILTELSRDIEDFSQIIALINRTIDRFGEVKDSASPELAEIRRSLASTQASVGSIMRRVVSRAIDGGYLDPETTSVVRSGRLVLPVSPMNKRKIPGIVHDESASGKTFYIEPSELVEANNRIRELQIEEKREISRILKLVTDQLRPDVDRILSAISIAGDFDFIRAKALFAKETGGCLPNVANKRQLEWYHAVNPVLEASLSRHGKKTVPLDIVLSQKNRILIISGPNAGGKSVCLKTIGLLQYMLQSGILPPVHENSHFGIFENIFIDIGDDQSIEDDLSTYSSHLKNMKFFLQKASKSTIILIDEFGSGTEPLIGGAIAQAILKQLNEHQVWGVITTHYQNIKTLAEDTPGLINGSMLYDRQLMQPLFKLSIGNAGSSFAIEIARKTGLPASIIDDAREIVGSDYVNTDRFLLDIARDRRYWENKRLQIKQKEKRVDELLSRYGDEADELRQQRKSIIKEARKEAERIISESNAAVERTIREIRESQADKERTRIARQKLADEQKSLKHENKGSLPGDTLLKKAPKRKENSKKQPAVATKEPAEIKAGDFVKMSGQQTVGTVIETDGKKAIVTFGSLRMKVPTSQLTLTKATPKTAGSKVSFISSQTTDASRNRQLNFSQEIDLRGMRLDEALQQVTYYIDDAIQFNAHRVRILHGTGTGALREGIRQYLSQIDGIATFHDEHPQFGGAGVTVVDFE